jgi:hypothetical protein
MKTLALGGNFFTGTTKHFFAEILPIAASLVDHLSNLIPGLSQLLIKFGTKGGSFRTSRRSII